MSERDQQGRTADGVAVSRAGHRLYDRPVIFDDPWAIELIAPEARRIVRNRLLNWWFIRRPMKAFRGISCTSFACARYTEERLDEALAAGVDQFLIIGAGLDSFALRRSDLEGRLRVFEIDHPATQRLKRERVAAAVSELPRNLAFVPVDFESQSIADGLAGTTFRPDRPAFCSWLGVVSYLTHEATFATLRSLRGLLAPGSEIVFNYPAKPEFLDDDDRRGLAALAKSVVKRGEPFQSAFDPDALVREVEAIGFSLVEQLDRTDVEERYFQGRTDGLRPLMAGRLARFAVGE